jgi:glutamyl-tRNA synthetase
LRIEDTDRARSTEAAVGAIFKGLDWLGVQSDAEPVYQFSRLDRHREVVDQLLSQGRAYRCFMTVEELEAERAHARSEGRAVRSPWRDRDPPTGSNLPFVIRFRGPKEADTVIDDLVQGSVRFANAGLDDLVLLRADGVPTYNLAVVVDDHDMGVTHVIRGDDHLNNAPRQSLLYEAMGWARPAFAHIPLIHGPDGAKLSKRHGAQAVGEFAAMGYLPEAMRNYLARLGWSHGDDEIFSDEEAIAWFDIKDVGRAPARLDWDKLNHLNAHYLARANDDRLARLAATIAGPTADEETLRRVVPLVKTRAKTVVELIEQARFVTLARPIALDPKAQAQLTGEAQERLARLKDSLAAADWREPELEAALKSFAESEGVGMGKIGPPLRAALTGGLPSPDLAKTLVALGREEVFARLEDALSHRT